MIRAFAALLVAGLTGCSGYNCQSTCNHVYADSECAVATGQADENTAIADCVDRCEEALSKTGEVGEYDPYSPYNGGTQPALENEKQAALWMECVWKSAPGDGYSEGCQYLSPEEGFCAPI